MANVNNGRKRNRNSLRTSLKYIIMFIIFGITLMYFQDDWKNFNQEKSQGLNQKQESEFETDTEETKLEGQLEFTMIDVGQADCFLLEQNGQTALIDCGTRSTGKDAVKYLNEKGITKLDYVFGTHPHDDHMGGMYDIITNFEVGKVIIPLVKDKITSNWYMKLISELSNGKYSVINPKEGDIYELGDATIKVIGQLDDANGNLNNYSTVLKVTYGDMDVIMTGDAEKEVEERILNSGEIIDSEVLKVGHHGSDTSTTNEFLHAVSPDYAFISCKTGNKYKHPSKATTQKLWAKGVRVFRTDEQGTVKAIITSNSVEFDKEPADYLSGPELKKMEEKQ